MVFFDVGQRVYNEGRIGIVIDTFVGEDGNTRYVVKFESNNPKVVEVVENFLAKDLELVEGVLMYAKPYVDSKLIELKERVEKLNKRPKLVIIRANNDEPSERYIRNKIKKCEEVGVLSEIIRYDENVTQEEIKNKIEELNSDDEVCGILLQLPIYEHLDSDYLIDQICPYKDVDGLGAYQLGWLGTKDKRALAPCTAKGVIALLDNVVEEGLVGKDICIVNCSYLIGIPLQTMLRDIATVTVCHKLTNDLKNKMRNADIVITGIGCAKYFDRSYVSNEQVIIDCSMNFDNGKLCGDYDLESLKSMDVLIASGAGHTGPMTVLSLMINTVQAYINQNII